MSGRGENHTSNLTTQDRKQRKKRLMNDEFAEYNDFVEFSNVE